MNPSDRVRMFCRENSYCEENLFVEKLRVAGLSTCEISAVIEAIESTCHDCWNADRDCQCKNDE